MAEKKDAVGDDPLESLDADALSSLLGQAPRPRGKAGKADEGGEDEAGGKRKRPPAPSRVKKAPQEQGELLPVERGDPSPAEPAEDAPAAREAAESPPASLVLSPDATEAEIREILQRSPRDPDAGIALARLQMERGDRDRALERLQEVQRAAPDHVGVKVRLGQAYAAMTAYPEAEAALEGAIRLDPDHAEARCELGIVRAKKGLYAQAVSDLERALATDPAVYRAHYYLGVCHNQLGRLDAAVEALERAVAADPRHERAWYQLGIVYDRKGSYERAREMYRKAREVRSG